MSSEYPTDPLDSGESSPETRSQELYQIVLINDDIHSYDYVIEMMATLFGMSVYQAQTIADRVHTEGRVAVKVCGLREALAGRDSIINFGPDRNVSDCTVSMRARIEPVV